MTCTKMSKHIYQKQDTYFSTIYISCFLICIWTLRLKSQTLRLNRICPKKNDVNVDV